MDVRTMVGNVVFIRLQKHLYIYNVTTKKSELQTHTGVAEKN